MHWSRDAPLFNGLINRADHADIDLYGTLEESLSAEEFLAILDTSSRAACARVAQVFAKFITRIRG